MSRLRRLGATLLALSALAVVAPAAARAQNPVRPAPADTVRRDPARPDPARPDSVRTDSLPTGAQAELVKWVTPDSILASLLERAGYRAVRYQGDTVRFDAQRRILTLDGRPAAVQREETILVGSDVVFNDSTQLIIATADSARRDSVILRDRSQADVIVRTSIEYNIASQSGLIRNFRTAATQGETWFVSGERGAVITDSTTSGGRIFYAHKGAITSCSDSVPHYHFRARDIKYVQKNLLVVRPAVLYIGDVPVLWLPFVFQDTRSGRRSGLLAPRIGIAELLRNSASYKRSLEGLGYYFNMGDYADAQTWFDWRSGARGDSFDPGWVRFNAETRYRVIDRFMQGDISASYLAQRDGNRNTTISARHEQSFNQNRRISANINWVQSTTLQRQNTVDPNRVLGTITSQVNFQDRFGPLTFSAGGTRKQYPGRSQVDQDFPNVNLSASTIAVTPWLDWTPTASFTNAQSFDIDQGLQFDSVFVPNGSGGLRSERVKASRRNTNVTFDTPLKIFEWTWQNSFRFTDDIQDFPQTRDVFRDINDTTTRERRLFNQGYTSNLFYTTGFSLPAFLQSTWKISPTVSISNIDPQFGMFVRTERTGGRWVSQGFRLSYGLSSSPTFYAFPPGVGPVQRFRHSISPVISYNFSPAKSIGDDFLRAVGSSRQGYLGSLKQSRVSLQLSSNLEAKLRSRRRDANDTTPPGAPGGQAAADTSGAASLGGARAGTPGASVADGEGEKIRLLSAQFTGLTYDFVIADSVGGSLFNRRGIVDQTWGYNLRSDLVPGLDFRANYSLFLGVPQSDTAVFKPYLTDVNVSFSLDGNNALFNTIGRLFGRSRSTPAQNTPQTPTTPSGNPRGGDAFFSQRAVAQQVAGSAARNSQFDLPANQPWQASFTFTSARQRPDIRGDLIDIDPTVQCQALRQVNDVLGYELCVARAQTTQQAGTATGGRSTYGAVQFRQQPTKSIQANTSFHLTQKWAAQWNTTFDMVRNQFASNVVSLQRELHDWRAVFAFTQSPNGNFSFNFFVALKAQPDLKFDYNRNTFRNSGSQF